VKKRWNCIWIYFILEYCTIKKWFDLYCLYCSGIVSIM